MTLSENVAALYGFQEFVFNSKVCRCEDLSPALRIPSWGAEDAGMELLQCPHAVGHRYNSALKLCTEIKKAVGPDILPETDYRYFNTLRDDSREGDFLKLFGKPLTDLPKSVTPPIGPIHS